MRLWILLAVLFALLVVFSFDSLYAPSSFDEALGRATTSVEQLITTEVTSEHEASSSGVLEKDTTTTSGAISQSSSPTARASSNVTFCPKFSSGLKKGDTDSAAAPAGTKGPVTTLQLFLTKTYSLPESTFTTGTFDLVTETFLKRYQREEGLVQSGIIDVATKDHLFNACLNGLISHGTEYPKKSFTFAVGGVTLPVSVHEALVESSNSIANGAVRIELVSVTGSSARVRVTAGTMGGLLSEVQTLNLNADVFTSHAPTPTKLRLVSVNGNIATIAISR